MTAEDRVDAVDVEVVADVDAVEVAADVDPVDLVDVVDENDVVIATVTRHEMRTKRLRHRGVFVAVVTSENRIVIHQRSPHKDIWPSRWDIGAGGVVDAGETYGVAAARELGEELGISAELLDLGGGYFEDDDVALFGRVFLARHDGPYHFTDGEIVAIEMVTIEELDQLVPQREWCSDSIESALPLLRSYMTRPTI